MLNRRGFTLIELLIVITILASLASIVMFTFPGVSRGARDAKRREELQQYRVALEVYANRNNGTYVSQDASAIRPHTMCGSGATYPLGNIKCTQDPKATGGNVCSGAACQYSYQTSGSGANYILWARLEKPADPVNKPCFVICSSGVSEEGSCPTGSSPACPL